MTIKNKHDILQSSRTNKTQAPHRATGQATGREGKKMYRVYSKYIKSGKVEYINVFDSAEDAIRHIYKCYRIDGDLRQLGEYYYFIK